MIEEILSWIGIFSISGGATFLLCWLCDKEEESEVFKLIKKDMLDLEMVWCGSAGRLRNKTKDYVYLQYNDTISFTEQIVGDGYIEFEVKLSKSESKQLSKMAEAIMVKKLLEKKS